MIKITERMLKHLKKKKSHWIKSKTTKAISVLEDMLFNSYSQHKVILEIFKEKVEQINPKDPYIKFTLSELSKLEDRVLDCASKLAPYQSPKLESMEIKSQVEHRMVMRAPQRIASVTEWAKATGAEVAKLEDLNKVEKKMTEPAQSLHDFDEEDDEVNTQKLLN